MKKSSSFVLCATAVSAAAVLSSCKPSQPASANPTASPAPTAAATATPEATAAPSASPAAAAGVELKDPVAVVNGEPISKAELQEAFDNAVKASGVNPADLTDAQKIEGYRQLLDELILDKLITKAAASIEVTQADIDAEMAKVKSQFPSEEEFTKQLAAAGQTPEKINESIKKMVQQQRWIESQVGDKTAVSGDDAKKFYDSNAAEFKEGPSVKASHILFRVNQGDSEEVSNQKLEAAKKAEARAKKGEDFNKLAKELSEEPGAKETGGDLGFFTKDRMVPEFADAAFTQKVGTVSDPVKTQFGWHVIKVTETRPERTVPFSEVEQQIVTYLKTEKQRSAVGDVLKKVRDGAKIENNLPTPPPAPAAPIAPEGAAAPAAPAPAEPAAAPAAPTQPAAGQ